MVSYNSINTVILSLGLVGLSTIGLSIYFNKIKTLSVSKDNIKIDFKAKPVLHEKTDINKEEVEI